jgi:glucose/arabinose dehydrogenase
MPRASNATFAACACAGLLVLTAHAAEAQVKSTQVVSGLTHPVAFVQDPSDPTIQYIVQQEGRIRVLHNGVLQATDFLNVSSSIVAGGEQGLLGLALPSDYGTSCRFYVHFTNPNGDVVVARFKRKTTTPNVTADPASRFDLRWSTGLRVINHPFTNHNSATLMFGPDGYLYISTGDGGSANDPNGNAQNMSSLLGKMLRIDVSVADSDPNGFAVPATNPFTVGAPREIWAAGLRNPWRYSFDDPAHGGTGAIVIGDVGQDAWEEIDYEPRETGAVNYGWRNREGAHDNVTSLPPAFLPLTDPIFEYSHSVGHAIIGGYVYRGSALGASMTGRYFFGDNVNARIWSLALTINPTTGMATASDLQEHTSALSPGDVSSFGVDSSGELYYCNYSAGTISKILQAAAPAITGVSPPGGSIGGATGVMIAGTGFQSGARVTFGGTAAASVVVTSATSIAAITPPHAAGAATVMVTNPDNQSAVAASAFTYRTDPVAPFGSFDTPLNGSTGLAGSIAITGWALDDAQVTRVTICRDYTFGSGPVDPNCNTQAQIYIGDAIFVNGARPDVQAAFPSTPFSARGGWGYLLLSNFLVNVTGTGVGNGFTLDQGNGTFTLRAYAYDGDGHVTPLGAKTITVNNSASSLPFGTIDTPAQGATVSGASYANFGWVLSPGTLRSDPPGGGTVQVFVDGAPIGSPGGWTARSDISSLFPQSRYAGVSTALGVFGLNTTTLADGLHTIAWSVTDNLGGHQGIGSRFFTVANGAIRGSGTGNLRSGIGNRDQGIGNQGSGRADLSAGSRELAAGRALLGRVGYDVDAPLRLYMPDAHGRVVVAIEELGRIELVVNATSGYLQTPAGRAPLPAGSRIDPATGTFTWQPGAGFLGVFDLVFDDLRVRIIVAPRR